MNSVAMYAAGDARALIDEADGLVTLTLNGPKLNALDAGFLCRDPALRHEPSAPPRGHPHWCRESVLRWGQP